MSDYSLINGSPNTYDTDSVKLTHWVRIKQNAPHFAEVIFKLIFLHKNNYILIQISLKFIPKGPINNKATFV